MQTLTPEQFSQALEWRYATKKFDPEYRISAEQWRALESSLQLAPSAYGLQPWHFVVVQDLEIRKQLRAASYNQPQITDSSALVVFAVKKEMGAAEVERFIQLIASVRDESPESLSAYKKMMLGFLASKSHEAIEQWSSRQVYIALGFFLLAAAQMGLDACPMEGLDSARYDQILGLTDYHVLCAAAVGQRHAEDPLIKLKKVRFPKSEVITKR